MEVKAVFFDIDGTLVNDSKSVLKSTKEAIKIVKEQGVLVGVATGRGPFFVKDLMDDLDLDFAVTYNGQYIFNKDRVLFASPIDKRSLRQIISMLDNRKRLPWERDKTLSVLGLCPLGSVLFHNSSVVLYLNF